MDWPYDDEEETSAEAAPTWDCPDEICRCQKVDAEGDDVEFSVMLLSPTGERMGDALCRIRHQGRVLNEDQPRSDPSGWVTTKVPRAPTTVLVEWAPSDAPQKPGYPHRCRYYVHLGDARKEAGRRRLHNLGYSRDLSLRENVKAFQRHYGYEKITGELDDIEKDLTLYHDEACPPVASTESEDADGPPPSQGPSQEAPVLTKSRDGELSLVPSQSKAKQGPSKLAGDPTPAGQEAVNGPPPKPQPQNAAPDPGTKGAPSAGQGCVKISGTLPKVKTMMFINKALFELVRIASTWTDPQDPKVFMTGVFWTFSDAVMMELPDNADWAFWKGTKVDQPLPKNPFGGVKIKNRKRLIRLPCTGKEAQEAADFLELSQADLLAADGGEVLGLPAATSTDRVPCLLPTAELYDMVYDQADIRIAPQSVTNTGCVTEVTTYADKVADAIDAAQKKSTTSTARMLGTPGKIWAIADRMDSWVCCCFFSKNEFACINHGFHQQILGHKNGRPILKMIQNRGGCHDGNHTDYSQIFTAIAGWCLVKDVSDTRAVWRRTEAVYRDANLCKLVRDTTAGSATPVPATRYLFEQHPSFSGKPTTVCTKGVAPCPP